MIGSTIDLFGNNQIILKQSKRKIVQLSFYDYDGFVEKFEPKKTTDDCYTPEKVYSVVIDFISERFDLSGKNVVRPFYPGGDYENLEYLDNDVVIDNPPFSIISSVARFYIKNGIKFFLFAPHLTLFSSDLDCTYLVCGASVIYKNGANVKTSFLTNMLGGIKILGCADLLKKLENINVNYSQLPKYEYPVNVLTVSHVQSIISKGIDISINLNHVRHIRGLDSQKPFKKALFGSGFLLSEKAAAEKAAAEKAAAEKAAAEKVNVIIWDISDREMQIIKSLG